MYGLFWDPETGGVRLADLCPGSGELTGVARPVFFEELDLLGLSAHWDYPRTESPLLWAIERRYFYRGELVAEAIGGDLFTKPQVKIAKKGLLLEPVDVPSMLERNRSILDGLTHTAMEQIAEKFELYRKRVDTVAVAFSGGKDSLVLLDLVQRVLPPDEFVVVFSDTTMELSSTYDVLEKAKKRWKKLRFFTVRAPKPATETWKEFGPPSRLQRWCCTVHKSAPCLRFLREMVGQPQIKALILDGVRRGEGGARGSYLSVSEGIKHFTQINIHPLLDWSLTEVYLYLFRRELLFNKAYRQGMVRVGCSLCPFASQWSNFIVAQCYPEDIAPFLQLLDEYVRVRETPQEEVKTFIAEGCWGARAGGRVLSTKPKVFLDKKNGSMEFLIHQPKENWLEWAKTLGTVGLEGPDRGCIINGDRLLYFSLRRIEGRLEVTIRGVGSYDPVFERRLRAVANKVAYCVHCQTCEVECPFGALRIEDRVFVDSQRCTNCGNCLCFIEKGCLAAKSLDVGMGGIEVKGLDRYKGFGMRKYWLEEYLKDPQTWWTKNTLGNKQFESMRVWLREAGLVENHILTPLGKRVQRLGVEHLMTWAVIWVNLAYNSKLVQWYLKNVPWGAFQTRKQLIEFLPGDLKERTRENAVNTLLELFRHSPLGEDIGLGQVKMKGRMVDSLIKRGWSDPLPHSLLYSLYRLAEEQKRYSFTIREFYEKELKELYGPFLLFGIEREELTKKLLGLSLNWPEWIRVEIVFDLDNIYLNTERKSYEVLDLVMARL